MEGWIYVGFIISGAIALIVINKKEK